MAANQQGRNVSAAEFNRGHIQTFRELQAILTAWVTVLEQHPDSLPAEQDLVGFCNSLDRMAEVAKQNLRVQREFLAGRPTQTERACMDDVMVTITEPQHVAVAEACCDCEELGPNEQLAIRWILRPDMASVLRIESLASGAEAWGEPEFHSALFERNTIGMVVEHKGRIVGFMVYELSRTMINVLKFAVHPAFRRHGAGRRLIEKLKGKLHRTPRSQRKRLVFHVRETNTDGQRFLAAMGLRASLERAYFDDGEDALRFVFSTELS